MLRNLASSLFLTERDQEFYEGLFQADGKTAVKPPKYRGRVVTTLHKAKEVRPLVEKCITIAKKALPMEEQAQQFATDQERNSEGWRKWRESDQWQNWSKTRAPVVTARRRVFSILRDKDAVDILFNDIAPRYADREGGYTRILKMATPRLGDAGAQAILEFVGNNDRVKQKSSKPDFVDDTEKSSPRQQDTSSIKSESVDDLETDVAATSVDNPTDPSDES